MQDKGLPLHIQFELGHGIKKGDSLKYRGIIIGTVNNVSLSNDLKKVKVDILLKKKAKHIGRKGSLFWIVRPTLGLKGAKGLETIVGARYIAVRPANNSSLECFEFQGLENAPLQEIIEPDGLTLTLYCPQKRSLKPGTGIRYRQITVGVVLNVTLASNASSVEATLWISKKYKHLIRDNSKFWIESGLEVKAGIFSGLDVNFGSPETLIAGGIGFATPNDPGNPVKNQTRFKLNEKAKDSWLEWDPSLSASKK